MKIASFKEFFELEREKDFYRKLESFIDQEYKTKTIYPERKNIFKAFELCELDDVKVVIFGQDPFAQPRQAMGMSFSVPEGVKLPQSLKNIYTEIINEFDLKQEFPKSGDLTYLAKQGVLLLNTILTVEEGKALSHKCSEYDQLSKDIVNLLNEIDRPIVFMLWGDKAKKYKKLLNNPKHLVLEANHPSPLSANRGGWFGNGCFKAANEFLGQNNIKPIEWIDENSSSQMLFDI